MNSVLSAEIGLCSTYEKLLNDCEEALDAWAARSGQIRRIHLTGATVGGELLRLQARFARAYATLRKHIDRCERCQLTAPRTNRHRPPISILRASA